MDPVDLGWNRRKEPCWLSSKVSIVAMPDASILEGMQS